MIWLGKLSQWTAARVPCAIATVTEADGHTPRAAGAKMVVSASGESADTIGGGPVEHAAKAACLDAIRDRQCRTLRFALGDGDWYEAGTAKVTAGACGGRMSVFIEPLLPRKELVLFGAGHVAHKLAALAAVVDLPHRVYDPRPEQNSAARFPSAVERIVEPWDHLTEKLHVTADSYCVIMTHGHEHDESCLEHLLGQPVPYIGMMGSPKKVALIYERLRARGRAPDERVHSPVGLRIGGNTPGDIAVSILAEVLLVMQSGKAEHLRLPTGAPGAAAPAGP